jgi:DNA polymerase III psi subunit
MIVITVTYENKKRDHIFVSTEDSTKNTVGDVLRSNYLKSDEVMCLIDEDVHSIEIRNSEKKKKV